MGRPVLADPPRSVSLGVVITALFGRVPTQVGFLLAGMGLIFTTVFVLDSELVTKAEFTGEIGTTRGVVTHISTTGARENSRRIWRADYRYEVGAQELTGHSFGFAVPRSGDEVKIEYVVADPTISRIEGLRRRKFHAAVAAVGIIPALGVIFLLVGFALGVRELGLLRHGAVGWARVLGMTPTNMRINHRRVMRIELELDLPGGGTERILASTHVHEKVGDEKREQVLYAPDRPKKAVVIDAIRRFVVRDDGTLAPRLPASLFLIGPTIVAAGYTIVAVLFFR